MERHLKEDWIYQFRKWQVMDMGISLSNINNVGLEQFITTSSKSIILI
jgi:hypothetical protein